MLLAELLRPDDFRAEPFVSSVLQHFLLADGMQSRAAAAELLAKLTPSVKHLSCLEVTKEDLPASSR